jgi:hypothetical protein
VCVWGALESRIDFLDMGRERGEIQLDVDVLPARDQHQLVKFVDVLLSTSAEPAVGQPSPSFPHMTPDGNPLICAARGEHTVSTAPEQAVDKGSQMAAKPSPKFPHMTPDGKPLLCAARDDHTPSPAPVVSTAPEQAVDKGSKQADQDTLAKAILHDTMLPQTTDVLGMIDFGWP